MRRCVVVVGRGGGDLYGCGTPIVANRIPSSDHRRWRGFVVGHHHFHHHNPKPIQQHQDQKAASPWVSNSIKRSPLRWWSQMEHGAAVRAGNDAEEEEVVFKLSPSSAVLKIKKGDITRWSVDGSSDAIVNPANQGMLGGGGADGAIHRAAGPQLVEACRKVAQVRPGVRCPTGEARITPGFQLPASHVIHTVGPIYDTDPDPSASLANAYRNSLALAKSNNIQYFAFPAISCGVFGYPYEEAATVAISTVKEFANDLKEVHFVLFSDEIYDVWLKKAKELLQS